MRKHIVNKAWGIIFFLLAFVGLGCSLLKNFLTTYNIAIPVVLTGCSMLGWLCAACIYMHYKAVQNSNPNVLVRSVMLSTILKLVIIVASLVLYLHFAGKSRSIGAIAIVMASYVIFLIIEVRATSQMNKVKDGNN